MGGERAAGLKKDDPLPFVCCTECSLGPCRRPTNDANHWAIGSWETKRTVWAGSPLQKLSVAVVSGTHYTLCTPVSMPPKPNLVPPCWHTTRAVTLFFTFPTIYRPHRPRRKHRYRIFPSSSTSTAMHSIPTHHLAKTWSPPPVTGCSGSARLLLLHIEPAMSGP